jgi:hypothetical protein
VREREGLIARIRQIRRATATPQEGNRAASPREPEHLRSLESRIEHLEQLLQGLQDSVHRESLRHDKRIGELEARIQPGTLGKALSDDARARGL